MAADITSGIRLYFDVPISTVAGAPPLIAAMSEKGAGAVVRLPAAGYTGLVMPGDRRGAFLDCYQRQPAWPTTTTGSYARKRASDFTVVTGLVDEVEVHEAGDYWLYTVGAAVVTTTGTGWTGATAGHLRANPHIHISLYMAGIAQTPDTVFSVLFGAGAWRFDLYGDGNGALVDVATGEVKAAGAVYQTGDAMRQRIHFRIDPLFRRCIYVFGHGLAGWSYEDTSRDASVDATDPAADTPMVAAGVVTLTTYQHTDIQMTEIRYLPAGAVDIPVTLKYAPTVAPNFVRDQDGRALARKDTPTGTSIVQTAPGFPADGTADTLTLHVALATTDPYASPTLYSAGYSIPPVASARVGDSIELTADLAPGMRYTVDEDRSRLEFTVIGHPELRGLTERLVLLTVGDEEEFLGVVVDSDFDEKDFTGSVRMVVEDEMTILDRLPIPDKTAWDGGLITDAVKGALVLAGLDAARWDIGTSDSTLPAKDVNGPGATTGHPNAPEGSGPALEPDNSTTVGKWIRYLADTYSSWPMFFRCVGGVRKLVFKTEFPVSPPAAVAEFYPTTDLGEAAGYDVRYNATDGNFHTIGPEANEIHVYGRSPAGSVLHAWYRDDASQDPTVAPADRALNWFGYPVPLIVEDEALSTIEQVEAACKVLACATVFAVETGSVENVAWVPAARRGERMTYKGHVYRIKGLEARVELEAATGGHIRPTAYHLERRVL